MRLPPRIPGAGSAVLPAWPPVHTARGPGGLSGAHAHHAIHLVLSHGGLLRVEVDAERHQVPGVLTAPDVKHAVDARGAEVTIVFLDPESDAGERLRATLRGPTRLLTAIERDAILGHEVAEPAIREGRTAWTDLIMRALGAEPAPRRTVHPRVRKLLRHLCSLPPSADTSLEALAAAVGLSPGRLMHVFTASVGIPLRPYLGWLRLQRAAAAIVSGVPLSQAAATAGFVDAAHMTRAFRAMYGTTPSSLRERAASTYKPPRPDRRTLRV